MIILDTHVWLWWTSEPKRLSRRAATTIRRADKIGVCTISVFELAERVQHGQIALDLPLRTWVRLALTQQRVEALPLTAEIGLDAAELRFQGDPADRVIYATARDADARLVTRDERLRDFDRERTLW